MDRNLEPKLRAWIDAHFDEMIGHLAELVAIPSVATYDDPDTPYGKPCKQVLEEMLKLAATFGLTAANCDDRCGTMTYTPDAQDEIDLWCHLDVVPAGEGWLLTEPFKPIIRSGYMIGRGADDNKGPALGLLYVLRAMNELGVSFRHGIKLCVGCDEEHGMSDVTYYAQHYPAAKLSIIADSGFPVCYGEKGILELNIVSRQPVKSITMLKAGMASNIVPDKAEMHIKGVGADLPNDQWRCVTEENGETVIRTTGLSRHSAFPEGGVNAIGQLTEAALASGLLDADSAKVIGFFNAINADYLGTAVGAAGSDEVSGYTTCVGSMASLTEDGRTCLHLNIRYCITADSDAMLSAMRRICDDNGCELVLINNSKPNYFPREAPVVDALTNVFNEMTGLNKEPFVMGGGTYARKLPNAIAYGLGGMPKEETDLFAPGHGGAHQCDEGLHLANLKEALIIFGMALIEADRIL